MRLGRTSLFITLVASVGCQTPPAAPAATPPSEKASPPTPAEAKAFAERVNRDFKKLWSDWERAEWVKATYITYDTEVLAAQFHEKVLAYTSKTIKASTRFDGLELDPETARTLKLLKVSATIPAPADEAKRKRLAQLSSELGSMYGKGEFCEGGTCRDLGELSTVIAEVSDYDAMLEAWNGWRAVSRPMRAKYAEMVELANAGAQELGFSNVGELWRAKYDMSPDAFRDESERLWNQVKPLYEALHCHVRA
ncbi:MAG: M2 family metallopeptidase, partial [Myxococcota bacterium]